MLNWKIIHFSTANWHWKVLDQLNNVIPLNWYDEFLDVESKFLFFPLNLFLPSFLKIPLIHYISTYMTMLVYLFFLTACIPACWQIAAMSADEILSGLDTTVWLICLTSLQIHLFRKVHFACYSLENETALAFIWKGHLNFTVKATWITLFFASIQLQNTYQVAIVLDLMYPLYW